MKSIDSAAHSARIKGRIKGDPQFLDRMAGLPCGKHRDMGENLREPRKSLPSNLYYFKPFAAGAELRELGDGYRLIPIERAEEKLPALELPAVLLADAAENDLARLEKSGPKSDAWQVICLLDEHTPPPAKLRSRIFAILPRGVPLL